jgi:hypothetical protein
MKLFSLLIIIASFFLACQPPQADKQQAPITEEETQIAKDLIQGAFDDLWGGSRFYQDQ